MAISSSSIVPSKAKNGRALVNEKIDERILRLLGLEDVFDIDYDTYSSLLKEAMVKGRIPKTSIPTEEIEMVTYEWKRIKGKSGRFKVKKITAASFKKGTAVGMNLGKKKLLTGIRPLALPSAVDKMTGGDDFVEIKDLLAEIIKNLTQQNKSQKDATERSRKEAENAKRAVAESNLEKGFKFAIKAAERVIAPIKSLLSRIIDFFMAIFWGKVFLKLLDWFADPANKKKIDSLFRFFGDHWPKLLALYLRFGTGLGKFVGGFTKLVFFGTRKLLQVVASMLGAKGAARFLGGRGGRLVAAGLQVATTVGTTMALSSGIEKFVGGGKEEKPKTPTFSGGGLANLKKLFGFYGGGPGHITGQKGVDKIPAMLSDGEFVMSRGAVQKYGVDTLEAMNAAGGGTNRPKMISGVPYAAGGGLIGYAGDMIKNHEALSSLRPGQNYYVSVKSPEYKKVSNSTKIYPYLDSVNVPTIGWGATYYDNLLKGSKKVKMGDPPITKTAADNLLTRHLSQLIPLAKSKLPLWNKMSPQQQGTVVSFLYNAGPNSIDPMGPYPKFSKALIAGNMSEASRNITRGGPALSRINEERKLLSTGPSDLTKVKQPTTVASKPRQQPNLFDRLSSGFSSMIGKASSIVSPPAQAKEPKYAKGGMVPAKLSKTPTNLKNISPPSKPSVVVRTVSSSGAQNVNIPGSPGAPRVPSFSSARIDKERKRILDIHSIA